MNQLNDHRLPLRGVKVLDFTRILSGPYATTFLAELGAEIIKVERPCSGDDTRSWGPPFLDSDETISTYFAAVNKGKASIAVDFSKPDGRSIIHKLVKDCDVMIENFRPGVAKRYALDHSSLAAVNPQIVTASISGFGTEGAYAGYPGTEIVVEAMSGLMDVTGPQDGAPVRFGIAMTDIATGLSVALKILAALPVAKATGTGTHVASSLYETAIGTLGTLVASASHTGKVPRRWGSHHPTVVPYGGFPTADGEIITGVVNDRTWPRFCEVIGATELLNDSELATNAGRVRNRQRLEEAIGQHTARFQSSELVQKLTDAELLVAPIRTVAEMLNDPETERLGVLSHLTEFEGLVASRVSGAAPSRTEEVVPRLGADTVRILRDTIGMTEHELNALVAAGVLGAPTTVDVG